MNKKDKKDFETILVLEEERGYYEYVMERERAITILKTLAILDDIPALDFETTGLEPLYSHVRLSCIYHPSIGAVLIDHKFCGSFEDLVDHFLPTLWAVYNAKFETRWFDACRPNEVELIDVDFLEKVHRGGGPSSLAMMVKRTFGIDLNKEQQVSDWTRERLSPEQLNYAADDAFYTYKLLKYWSSKINDDKKEAAFMLQDAVRPTVECEETGLILDADYHMEVNIKRWKMKQALMLKRVRHWTNEKLLPNINSNKQVSDLLKTQLGKSALSMWPKTEKTEQLSLDRKVIQPIVAKSPYPFSRWMNALIRYRYYAKYLSTYGETLVTKQYLADAIYYRLNIGQAATLRYSSSSINIQNIPRAAVVRRAFRPPALFDFLVVADYSGIEVRILAELSNDDTLRQDAIYGDVHAGSASAIYKIDLDEFTKVINEPDEDKDGNPLQHSQLYYQYKEMRSRAKGFTFQNIYGASALALSIVLNCSVSDAEEALRQWAKRYPRAYGYRHIINDQMQRAGYLPVCDGRTIFVYKQDRTLPVAANYGVQGAAASVMYRAMYHVWRIRNEESNHNLIRMCATVHDEIIMACMDGYQTQAKDILQRGMIQGYLDIFPGASVDNLIEAKAGLTWGDAK